MTRIPPGAQMDLASGLTLTAWALLVRWLIKHRRWMQW